MKFITLAACAVLAVFSTTAIASDLPDLGGKSVVVVTENAYPPLQFIEPATGNAIGWEYDAMAEIAKRINITVEYENISWDAMVPAVSEGQYDLGMTGITIREDRAEIVDFSEAYLRSEMVMMVRGDEDRFSDAASFDSKSLWRSTSARYAARIALASTRNEPAASSPSSLIWLPKSKLTSCGSRI